MTLAAAQQGLAGAPGGTTRPRRVKVVVSFVAIMLNGAARALMATAEFGPDSRHFSLSVVAGARSHHGTLRGQQRVVYCT